MNDKTNEGEISNLFQDMLAKHRRGFAANKASTKLREAILASRDTGAKSTVTVTVTLTPGTDDQMKIDIQATNKLPDDKLPIKWNKQAEQRRVMELHSVPAGGPHNFTRPRVFCASLADWLDDEVPIEWLTDLLDLIHKTPNLDWLMLTKRPENFQERIKSALIHLATVNPSTQSDHAWLSLWRHGAICPKNVWVGTTVENQEMADKRIPLLLSIPARIRFLSCEPLLGPVDVTDSFAYTNAKHWVIAGGESGPNARAMHPDWARSLRDQCQAAGVPFFFKQWGEWLPGCQYQEGDLARFKENAQHSFDIDNHSWWVGNKLSGRTLDGQQHHNFPTP